MRRGVIAGWTARAIDAACRNAAARDLQPSARGLCASTAKGGKGEEGEGRDGEHNGATLFKVVPGEGARLDKVLARERPSLPFSIIQKLIRNKKVSILRPATGEWARVKEPNYRVEGGETLRVHSKAFIESFGEPAIVEAPRLLLTEREKSDLIKSIVFTHDELLIINKPSGLAVQGGSKQGRHLDRMLHGLVPDGAPEPLLVHRLDRDTSGCMAVARSKGAAARISAAFSGQGGLVTKQYLAVVAPAPEKAHGVVDSALEKVVGKDGEPDKVRVVANGGKRSVTEYEVISASPARAAALVKLSPKTGRTHQLRVHCASVLKCAIVGDAKYSPRPEDAAKANLLCLHSHEVKISWEGANGGETTVSAKAPVPKHMWDAIGKLGIPIPGWLGIERGEEGK